jgi:hypothetical protein
LSKSGLSGSTLSSVGSGNKSGKESGDGFIKLLILLYILAEMKAAKKWTYPQWNSSCQMIGRNSKIWLRT